MTEIGFPCVQDAAAAGGREMCKMPLEFGHVQYIVYYVSFFFFYGEGENADRVRRTWVRAPMRDSPGGHAQLLC